MIHWTYPPPIPWMWGKWGKRCPPPFLAREEKTITTMVDLKLEQWWDSRSSSAGTRRGSGEQCTTWVSSRSSSTMLSRATPWPATWPTSTGSPPRVWCPSPSNSSTAALKGQEKPCHHYKTDSVCQVRPPWAISKPLLHQFWRKCLRKYSDEKKIEVDLLTRNIFLNSKLYVWIKRRHIWCGNCWIAPISIHHQLSVVPLVRPPFDHHYHIYF